MMALFLNILVYLVAIVYGSLDELEPDFGSYRELPDRELKLDFYKRLASIDLQDVKRLQTGDSEYGEESFPSSYKTDNFYGEGSDGFGEMENEEEDAEQFIGDKSAAIRDPELTQHSSNLGIIQMSESEKQQTKTGSASESLKAIKSDDPLPFYCHPPNPCPKGYSSKDNCQEFIEDTADYQKEWIQQMQRKGICSCDEEHMFDCSSEAESLVIGSKEDMEKFFTNFVKEKEQTNTVPFHQENPFTQRGQKRISLVAKKSPRFKRDDKYALMNKEMDKMVKESRNPYLAGKRLPTVAKKGIMKRDG